MSVTAFSGPVVSIGQAPAIQMPTAGYNQDLGPSMFWGGGGMLDPRMPVIDDIAAVAGVQPRILGFTSSTYIPVLDVAPPTAAAAAIAAAQVPTAGTPLTKVTVNGAGVTVLTSATQIWSVGSILPIGTVAINGASGFVSYGQTGATSIYDATKALARNVTITSVGNDSTGSFLVAGWDIYGAPMTERITGANAGVAAGKKAFKFVASITPAATLSGSNVSVGTGDVLGFPIFAAAFSYVWIFYNGAWITATTGFLAGVTTSPATATTGDVRGTYALQSASDGTKTIQIFITPSPINLGSITGLFGVTQA